ncbi:MAG: hypothetical protein IJA12_08565 [Oscillospiraceae bacterium]|nr:hypothetical protein [Oscillospiraceae bacterium]
MSKKRNSKLNILIVLTFIIVVSVGVVGFYKGSILLRSDKVTATVTKDLDSYVRRHKEKRESSGEKRKYYIVTVYQNMEIKYELDGETVTQNTGFLAISHSESRIRGTYDNNTTDQEYIDHYAYDVGDEIELYITDDGEVHLGTIVVDVQYYKYIFFAFGGLLIFLILSKVIKRNLSDD